MVVGHWRVVVTRESLLGSGAGASVTWQARDSERRWRRKERPGGIVNVDCNQIIIARMRNPVACVSCRSAKQKCIHEDRPPCDRCRQSGRAELCQFPGACAHVPRSLTCLLTPSSSARDECNSSQAQAATALGRRRRNAALESCKCNQHSAPYKPQ